MAEVAENISSPVQIRRTAGAGGKGISPKCRIDCPLSCAGPVQKMYGTVIPIGMERNHRT